MAPIASNGQASVATVATAPSRRARYGCRDRKNRLLPIGWTISPRIPPRFPGYRLGDGVRRHPTQLYEVLFLAGLGGILVGRAGLRATTGDRFKCCMVAYMGFRLLVDFIKPAVRFGGLSAIQWACVAVLAYYAPHVPRLIAEVRRG